MEGVVVPESFVIEGHIVLNIAASAVRNFQLKDDIVFNTRFHGSDYRVSAPVAAVVMIFDKENGQGMAFDRDTYVLMASDTKHGITRSDSNDKPNLRIVK